MCCTLSLSALHYVKQHSVTAPVGHFGGLLSSVKSTNFCCFYEMLILFDSYLLFPVRVLYTPNSVHSLQLYLQIVQRMNSMKLIVKQNNVKIFMLFRRANVSSFNGWNIYFQLRFSFLIVCLIQNTALRHQCSIRVSEFIITSNFFFLKYTSLERSTAKEVRSQSVCRAEGNQKWEQKQACAILAVPPWTRSHPAERMSPIH